MIFYRVLTTVPVPIQKNPDKKGKENQMSKFLDYYHLLNIPEEKRNNSGIGQPATIIPPHELRQAYKRALLHHHPDKQKKKKKPQESTSSPTTYPPPAAVATIDEITEAYRVLGNASERAKYDLELRKWKTMNHQHLQEADVIITTRHTGMEIVDLEELDFEVGLENENENEKDANATATATATGIWKRACRCGSIPAFVVTEAELEKSADEGELVTGCKGCSLWLKVMFTVDDDDD